MELPPVLQLITSEIPPNKPIPANFRRLLKDTGFLKELSAQARLVPRRIESPLTDDCLNVFPTNSLNPLSSMGKCNSHNCRVEQAESFARSVGLYCDHAVLTDYITRKFSVSNISNIDTGELIEDVKALSVLMPMVRAGIIRISDTLYMTCTECCKKIMGDLSEKLWQLLLKDGETQFPSTERGKLCCVLSSKLFYVDGKPLDSTSILEIEEGESVPLISRKVKIRNLPKKALNLVKKSFIRDVLTEAQFVSSEACSAADKAAVIVTNSRRDATILRKLDNGSLSKSFDDWESLRSVQLPWVSNLSVEEIIQLRENASKALPKFRDRMNKELFSISAKTNDPDKFSLQVVKSLREEANELEGELSSAAIKTGHTGHLAIGTTGISCIVYGIGAKDPTAIQVGATTLITALAAMYHPSKNAHADHAQLKTKPAYVLLSAREIIRNRKK